MSRKLLWNLLFVPFIAIVFAIAQTPKPGPSLSGGGGGATGATGPTGPTGPTGATGATGASGVIASGATALGTSAIASTACATVVTAAATGTLSTDTIAFTPNASIKALTGYAAVTAGGLQVSFYPTVDTINIDVCNPTLSSITPSALTLNWRVIR